MPTTCPDCTTNETLRLDSLTGHADEPDDVPTTWWHCTTCQTHLERFRGEGDQTCVSCGAWYNAAGQRLRDDWMDNPAWRDGGEDPVDDLTGFELAALAREGRR